jgi:hypothetical protein
MIKGPAPLYIDVKCDIIMADEIEAKEESYIFLLECRLQLILNNVTVYHHALNSVLQVSRKIQEVVGVYLTKRS